VPCKELNKDGYVLKRGTYLDKDIESIVCPGTHGGTGNRPVIIRVEKTVESSQSVVMPISGKPTKTMTYFPLFPEQVDAGSLETGTGSHQAVGSGPDRNGNCYRWIFILMTFQFFLI
jgi:hypothetical protein